MNTLRRLWAAIAPIDPNPEPSTLDRWDGCMVLACSAEHTDERHGWRTCADHAPRVMMVGAL